MSDIFEGHRPLVAILRGVEPHEVLDIGEKLIEAGFGIIEVPLNSPEPMKSISKLNDAFGQSAIVGAGTVLSTANVDDVINAGGRLIVSPDMKPDVIKRTIEKDGLSFPGVFTPTEAFAAIDAGCHALKFFPASLHGPDGVKAIKAVLPPKLPCSLLVGQPPQMWAIGSPLEHPDLVLDQASIKWVGVPTKSERKQGLLFKPMMRHFE